MWRLIVGGKITEYSYLFHYDSEIYRLPIVKYYTYVKLSSNWKLNKQDVKVAGDTYYAYSFIIITSLISR
jgi:hypothetical protein